MPKSEKQYAVYYGDAFFRLAPGRHFVAELTDDDRIREINYDVDITEYANYGDSPVEGYEDYTTESLEEAQKTAEELDAKMA